MRESVTSDAFVGRRRELHAQQDAGDGADAYVS